MQYLYALLLLLVSTVTKGHYYPPLEHSASLEENGRFVLLWSLGEKEVTFEIQARTMGYMGLGFSPNGGMAGSDIIMGWISEYGLPILSDRHATGYSSPVVDKSQDVQLVMGYRNNTHSVIRFKRPWVTCDAEEDRPITVDTTKIIYALHDDIPDPREDTLPYHSVRGTKSIYLKEPTLTTKPQDAQDLEYFDWLAPNVSLPSDFNTLYWCKIYKVPDFDVKNHFVSYMPIIEEGHESFVHHIVVYECSLDDLSILEPWAGHDGAQCYSPNMPPSFLSCNVPVLAWAIGSDGAARPDHVGTPLGAQYNGFSYVMFEIHYDNPKLVPGIFDNSGLRMYHTPKLRQFDTGHLMIGATVHENLIIGNGVDRWKSVFYCSPDCLGSAIPPEGIKIVGGLLHAHLSSKSMIVRHIRDGVELEPLLKDMNYDFNYQQERTLQKEVTVLPGDLLITECEYETTNYTEPVFGGVATNEEMCMAFINYYPRTELGQCLSRLTTRGLLNSLNVSLLNMEEAMKPNKATQFMRGFSEAIIPLEYEKKLLQNRNQAGKDGVLHTISKQLMRYVVDEPADWNNQTIYDMVYDPAYWKNPEHTKQINERFLKQEHVVNCYGYGRKSYNKESILIPEPPKFVPYTSKEFDCKNYI